MIKQVVKDTFFLGQKSEIATKQDLAVGQDLQDTLTANRERCVGMAANMIGVRKRIIIVNMGLMNMVMYNPVIVKKDTPYETEEGCLSLEGVRKTTRFQNIEVEYLDGSWKKHRQAYSGWIAQIIQHEVDQLEGKISEGNAHGNHKNRFHARHAVPQDAVAGQAQTGSQGYPAVYPGEAGRGK